MRTRIPEIHPVTELARDARGLIERARQLQEPMVITQRGRDTAILLPIELYRWMETLMIDQMISPRLVRPEDAAHFTMEMTVQELPATTHADV